MTSQQLQSGWVSLFMIGLDAVDAGDWATWRVVSRDMDLVNAQLARAAGIAVLGKYTPRKFPLPTDDKGTSQPVKPKKGKRAPKGKVNRTPGTPASPAVQP